MVFTEPERPLSATLTKMQIFFDVHPTQSICRSFTIAIFLLCLSDSDLELDVLVVKLLYVKQGFTGSSNERGSLSL